MNLYKKITLATLSLVFATQVHASNVALVANGDWYEFNVDDFSSVNQGVQWIDLIDSNSESFGSTLTYQFTIDSGFKGFLSVVDAGIAGDSFEIFNNGQSIGYTSDATNSIQYSNDFTSNLNNSNFSSGVFTFTEGTYNISGALISTLQPFNSTNGAVKLDVTSVPLPGAFGLFAGGLSLLAFIRRRRS